MEWYEPPEARLAIFFGIATAIAPLISTGFLPARDNAQTTITLTLPPGSTLEDTAAMGQRASALLQSLPEVKSVFMAVGTAFSGSGPDASSLADLTSATLTVNLVPRINRKLRQSDVEAKMRALIHTLPGVRVSVNGGGNGNVLNLTLAGDDPQTLLTAATQVEAQLRTLMGIGNVTSSAALQRPELQAQADFSRAAALGVTSQSLADAVRLATYGDYSSTLPKLNLPQRQIPIRVQMDPSVRDSPDSVAALRVAGREGTVSLGSVAKVAIGSGPTEINRIDRSRNVTFSVELNGRPLGAVQKEAMSLPALRLLPANVHLVEQGEAQRMSEMFTSFGLAMGVGVFCIYATLVLLFHDFLQPATILGALPLALGGALFALWITHQSFTMPAVIGVLMLMGIVTKNSILVVEYAIVARRKPGVSRFDALIDACRRRARPIVMTTIAMGAGMLPNALGTGAEPSFRQPMAIVVIGGLLTSTILSLLVVPVVFTYVDDLFRLNRRVGARRQAEPSAVSEDAT